MRGAAAESLSERLAQAMGTPIREIWSAEYAEDGVTFVVWVVLEDSRDAMFSFTPGRPISGGVL